ncbi:NosD domain-containing protein [Arthrobacter sp. Y81]|uniref:NosD domain-containing protein n=1 Tax=Arthrobacter sp. Y81 TaxID=2058897 RepID=UPI0015E3943B|nr:NosD domain-containing protein [Arthrobacter sp. Y81]
MDTIFGRNGDMALNVKAPPYNAKGDGVAVDRAAIQSAINDANASYAATGQRQSVFIPSGVYLLDSINYVKDDATTFGATSLKLLDGVELSGTGTLKVKNNAYGAGAFYRAISSRNGGASNAGVSGITIDGNKANQVGSSQCSNIMIEALANITVDNVKSVNANGNGIMVRGTRTTAATNLRITRNTVTNCTCVGIQCSQFDGLVIADNYVANTADNCIDIYGENGTILSNARNWSITGNTVRNGLVGIFPETSRDGIVSANTVSGCTIGVSINRINGQPIGVVISGNVIVACPTGVSVSGDTGGIQVRGNFIRDFTATGVQLGGGSGNISYVTVEGNDFQPNGATTYLINVAGSLAAFLRARNNSTTATNRAYDLMNTATTNVMNILEPPHCQTQVNRDQNLAVTGISVASGGTFTIPIPANTSGILTVKGTMGGGWQSAYVAAVASGSAAVAVAQSATTFTTPGNSIRNVAGSTTSLNVTVLAAASGSFGSFAWSYRYL